MVKQHSAATREHLEELLRTVQSRTTSSIQALQQPGATCAYAPEGELEPSNDLDLIAAELSRATYAEREIVRALKRMTDGEYGRCENCAADIGARRLCAIPFATRCLNCQAAFEAGRLNG